MKKWERNRAIGRIAAVSKTSRSAWDCRSARDGSGPLRLVPPRSARRNTAAILAVMRAVDPISFCLTYEDGLTKMWYCYIQQSCAGPRRGEFLKAGDGGATMEFAQSEFQSGQTACAGKN